MSDESKKAITGLPSAKATTDSPEELRLQSLMDGARKCPKCGRAGRIVSNYLGINGHCGPCQIHWPITNSPLKGETVGSTPRGLSKVTSVEPDWNMALDRDIGDS
jgi:hypothetical protein